jgi:predicted MFS family arabinose efflux permease
MGCAIILISLPINLLVIRTRPADMGLQPDGGILQSSSPQKVEGLTVPETFKAQAFWLIAAMMLLFGLVAMGIGVHLMPYLTDIGHMETTAGLIIALISLMTVVGKLGIGIVADRWGIRQTVILTCGMILVGIVLLMKAELLAVACVFAGIYGFAIGAPLVINPALTAQCLGLAHFGAIFGILTLFNTLGAAIGAVLTGAIYDGAKSYMPAFLLFMALTAVAAFCGVSAKRKSAT